MSDSAPQQNRMIELHIDELILEGFPVSDPNRITSVVQQELHRLLSQGELPSRMKRNGDIERLDGGAIQIEPRTTPENTGVRIARSLYGGLQ